MRNTLIATLAFGATTLSAGTAYAQAKPDACAVESKKAQEDAIQQFSKTGKRVRYSPDIDAFYAMFYGANEVTVESTRAWIASNPRNICLDSARLTLRTLEQAKGYDEQRIAARAARLKMLRSIPMPGPSPARFKRPAVLDDYPDEALRFEQSGTVKFELSVDEVGAITGCVTPPGGFPSLNRATCRIMQRRGLLDPARDAKGMPVASKWPGSLTWTLP